MFDKINRSLKGYLNIWKKPINGDTILMHSNQNIILDCYHDNLANAAISSINDDDYKKIIPVELHLDNQGVDEEDNVITPTKEDRIDPTDEDYYYHNVTEKVIGEETNYAKFTTILGLGDANGHVFSRAMLTGDTEDTEGNIEDVGISLKCFRETPKDNDWELIFEWTIFY